MVSGSCIVVIDQEWRGYGQDGCSIARSVWVEGWVVNFSGDVTLKPDEVQFYPLYWGYSVAELWMRSGGWRGAGSGWWRGVGGWWMGAVLFVHSLNRNHWREALHRIVVRFGCIKDLIWESTVEVDLVNYVGPILEKLRENCCLISGDGSLWCSRREVNGWLEF